MGAQKHFVYGKCFLLQRCMMDWKTAILGNTILSVPSFALLCDGRFIKCIICEIPYFVDVTFRRRFCHKVVV
jgi:hypothetical protein